MVWKRRSPRPRKSASYASTRPIQGLIRYEQRSEVEWSKIARDLIAAEKPQAIVMLVGLHDRQAMRERLQVVAPKPPAAPKPGTAEAPRAVTAPPAPGSAQPPVPAKPAANPNDDETPVVAAPEPQRARPTGPVEFKTERWEELYGARIDETIAALKSGNVPVLWVGVPSVRGVKSTSRSAISQRTRRVRGSKRPA